MHRSSNAARLQWFREYGGRCMTRCGSPVSSPSYPRERGCHCRVSRVRLCRTTPRSCDFARESARTFAKSANRCAATELSPRHAWHLPFPCARTVRTKILLTQPGAGLRLQSVLRELELSEREAARVLRIDERVFAGWCAGHGKIPRIVWLSLAAIKIRRTWPE